MRSFDIASQQAIVAVNEWKRIWKELTFPAPGHDGHRDPLEVTNESALAKEVLELLERFSERVIELGERAWQIQKDALATAPWTKDKKKKRSGTGPKDAGTAGASTATADNASVAVHDSSEDPNDTGDSDDLDTAAVLEEFSKTTAKSPADLAEISATMEDLLVDS